MEDINEITLRGSVASEIFYNVSDRGTPWANFMVMVKRKKPSNARDFLRCIGFNEVAENAKALRKDDRVDIKGFVRRRQSRQRESDATLLKDGSQPEARYVVEVVVESLHPAEYGLEAIDPEQLAELIPDGL